MIPNVLSIAGSDPSGGAGIQADLKAIAANRAYGMAALTALTAQNTQGVTGVETISPAFVTAQIKAVFADVRVDAVKIGMIANAKIADAVADALEKHPDTPVVLDPVMIAKGGAPLLQPDAMDTLRTKLVPRATVITPNLPEAAHLLDQPVATTRDEMAAQAKALTDLGPKAALIKGGHLDGLDSPDVLCVHGEQHWFNSARTPGKNTHGTGCTLSSALAAQLAHGVALPDAIAAAKTYVTGAIAAADMLSVGHGHGPVHHFYDLWTSSK
ncbi:bifunctional hydroxymethylpyrimidine kinase/phosphomethylpyrimidine kinase [Tateyamaria sp. ANG-S1]|uniref:bifunctional hydroxymethylpyrimidine kinase/phosphomethylpyrimidine kinase n=1 Tax=Tateyamaria sp. ANG-S1 TaxID=1577905 RepID=UPI00057CCA4C|nr:bifunctional hydroxymethylpyrimidine kinase/phosphomethylpyrimidine kinase [Tateyamaria sp. ANG-S1]KIC48169.1 phosphomethylpyrimidine kinase [Tateyamaria sp. ANG-S1]